MPTPEVNFFAIVMTIQTKTGGNLSEALSNLATVLRDRKRMQAKIRAMSSEAKAGATIIGSLPPGRRRADLVFDAELHSADVRHARWAI